MSVSSRNCWPDNGFNLNVSSWWDPRFLIYHGICRGRSTEFVWYGPVITEEIQQVSRTCCNRKRVRWLINNRPVTSMVAIGSPNGQVRTINMLFSVWKQYFYFQFNNNIVSLRLLLSFSLHDVPVAAKQWLLIRFLYINIYNLLFSKPI